MNLTRHQRKQLFDGEPAKITFDGAKPCPIEVGHVERLSANVWFVVTDTRRSKAGEHVLVYTLHCNRLGQRFLATQHGQYYPQQYAHSGGSGVDSEAGEAVDAFTQRRLTEESHRNAAKRKTEAAGEMLAAMNVLRSAIDGMPEDRKRRISRTLWQLRARLDSAEREMRRRLAA